jgi:hypothetical protein
MTRSLTATFSFVVIFIVAASGFAQSSSSPYQTPGMFGPQSFNNSLYPRTASGIFGSQSYGGASFGTSQVGIFGNRFFGPAVNSSVHGTAAVRTPTPAATPSTVSNLSKNGNSTLSNGNLNQKSDRNNAAESPVAQENREQPLPAETANGIEGSTPSDQASAAFGAGNAAMPRQWAFATVPPTKSNDHRSFVRSAALSDRLTSIARDKGMLVGRRIDVLLQGDTAVLQGKVHGHGDRAALANVLSLEPRVDYIDNRLETE